MKPDTHNKTQSGFTLIEMSIVLVIIGLIVGGILTGRDLIDAAYTRAQISQIEKYNTAVRTFQSKYGYLPGDMPSPYASNFGFQARGTNPGEGDGNGVIESYNAGNSDTCGYWEANGETIVFWADLSTAGLIDGGFNTASEISTPASNVTETSTPALSAYFPHAKIGGSNYVYVWSGGWQANGWPFCQTPDGNNYFGVSTIQTLASWGPIAPTTTGISVSQAYNIDKKIDDGLPQSGHVTAIYLSWAVGVEAGSVAWAAGGGQYGAATSDPAPAPTTAATAGSATTCYDNSSASSGTPGVAGAAQHYSLEMSGGSNQNCALSFKFQ